MSKGIDIEFVRENYRKLTDKELIQAATTDAIGLTPEALEVVKEEIKTRGLDNGIIKGLEAQNKTYSLTEVDSYCNVIRHLDCPDCGSSNMPLNATMTSEVTSIVLFTEMRKKIRLGCPDCLDKANQNALIKTALFGWWAIPWGPIRTIQSIAQNLKSRTTNHTDSPNNFLRSFTLSKIGEIESYKGNREKLRQIIANN